MKRNNTIFIGITAVVLILATVGISTAILVNKFKDGTDETKNNNEVYQSYISINSYNDSTSGTSVIDLNFEYYTKTEQVYIMSTEYIDSWNNKYDEEYTLNFYNNDHQRIAKIHEGESLDGTYYDLSNVEEAFLNLSYIQEESGAGVLEYTIASDISLGFNEGEAINWEGDVKDNFSVTQDNDYTDLSLPAEPVNAVYESHLSFKYYNYKEDKTYWLIDLNFEYYTETEQVWFGTSTYNPSNHYSDTSDWYFKIQTHSNGTKKINSGDNIEGAFYPLLEAKEIIYDITSIYEGSGNYPTEWVVNDIQLIFKEGQPPAWEGSLYPDFSIVQYNYYTVL